jgi:endonuclease YncB( thermonuclease family)
MTDDFTRAFKVLRVVDGDTLHADVDLGYHAWLSDIQYRLARIDCPERHKPTLDAGNAAKAFTEDWLIIHTKHGGLFATTTKTDDFGRYIADIRCSQEHDLSDALLDSGNAVPYKAK